MEENVLELTRDQIVDYSESKVDRFDIKAIAGGLGLYFWMLCFTFLLAGFAFLALDSAFKNSETWFFVYMVVIVVCSVVLNVISKKLYDMWM